MAEEYDDLLRDTLSVPAGDEYDEILNQESAAQNESLRSTMFSASKKNPDQQAKVINLSQKTGLPKDTVERNQTEIQQKVNFEATDYDELLKNNPVLSGHLSNPDFAELAHDDIEELSFWERTGSYLDAIGEGFGRGNDIVELSRIRNRQMLQQLGLPGDNLLLNVTEEEALRADELSNLISNSHPEEFGFVPGTLPVAAEQLPILFHVIKRGTQGGALTGLVTGTTAAGVTALAGQAGPQVAAPEEVVTVPAAFLAGGAKGFFPGFKAGSGFAAFELEGGLAFDEFKGLKDEDGNVLDEDIAAMAALGVGAVNASLEYISLAKLGKTFQGAKGLIKKKFKDLLRTKSGREVLTGVMRRYLESVGTEGITELLQEFTNVIGGEIAKAVDPDSFGDVDIEQVIDNVFSQQTLERTLEAGKKGVQAALVLGLPGSAVSTYTGLKESNKGKSDQQIIERIRKNAEESKLLKRSPEKYQEYVADALEGSGIETVSIPSDQLTEFFQEHPEAYEDFNEHIADFEAQYAEAQALGADVEVATDTLATYIAPKDYFDAISPDLRLHADAMTAREAQAFDEELQNKIMADYEQYAAEIDQTTEGLVSSDMVYTDVKEQLIAAGQPEDIASKNAMLHKAFFETMAERTGVDAFSLYQGQQLRVRSDQQRDELDDLIDLYRTGGGPTQAEAFGPTFIEFLRDAGGIQDEGGELTSRDLDKLHEGQAFTRNLVQQEGMSLDAAVEAAVEAGFVPEADPNAPTQFGINEMLELIDNELSGNPIFSGQFGDQQAQNLLGNLQQLDEVLSRAGIDITDITNQEVKDVLAGITGTEFDQPGITELFQQQRAERNRIGLFSAAEQAVLDMKLPQWKKEVSHGWAIYPPNTDAYAFRFDTEEEANEKLKDQPEGWVVRELVGTNPASGVEIWNKLKSSPGIKKEELEWTGIEDFLRSKGPKGKFTREETVGFIQENGVTVEETVAEEESADPDARFEWQQETWDEPEAWEYRVEDLMYEFDNDDESPYWFSKEQWLEDNIDDVVENYRASLDVDALEEIEQMEEDGDHPSNIISALQDAGYEPIEDMRDEMRDEAQEKAEETAEQEYLEDPQYIYYDEGTDLYIFGNDELGYSIRHGSNRWQDQIPGQREEIYSFNEAEIQATDYAYSEGLFGDEESETTKKWEDYVMDGYMDNYREIKLTLPEIEGDFYNDVHFPDRNIVTFLRVDDRELPTGEARELTEEELQREVDPDSEDLRNELNEKFSKEKEEEAFNRSKQVVLDAIAARSTEIDDQLQARINDFSAWESIVNEMGFDGNTASEYRTFLQQKRYAEDRLVSIGERYNTELAKKKRLGIGPKNTYFIDEFQSDWHQDGRQRGYATGEVDAGELEQNIQERQEELDNILGEIFDADANEQGEIRFNTTTGIGGETEAIVLKENFVQIAYELIRNNMGHAYEGITGDRFDVVKEKVEASENASELITNIQEDLAEFEKDRQRVQAERYGVPDAPFKGDGWISLGLKRAIVDAVENGYEAIAWADAEVLVDRWSESYRTLYVTQYDKKMPSLAKKATGIRAEHMALDGGKKKSAKQIRDEATEALKGPEDTYEITDQVYLSMNDSGNYVSVYERGQLLDDFSADNMDEAISLGLKTAKPEQGYWIIEITPELRDRIQGEGLSLFQDGPRETTKRGRILFTPEGETIIDLFKDANLSTFLHESGHLFLNAFAGIAAQPDAPQQVQEDMQAILKWLGVDSIEALNPASHGEAAVAAQEKWARGIEAYLREGKAPSAALQSAFQRFKSWLVNVYRSVRGLDVELTDDIRQVMDRMLATDDAIRDAQNRNNIRSVFESAEDAGLTEDQAAEVNQVNREAVETAKEKLLVKLLKEITRERKQWWRTEKKNTREEVEDEFHQRRDFKVKHWLQHGVLPDGTELGIDAVKLSKADLVAMYGDGATALWRKLPFGKNSVWSSTGGVHPDVVAGMFGFKSGDELVKTIIDAGNMKDAINEETQRRMLERHGDILNDGSIEAEADEAMHNINSAEAMLADINALNKKTGRGTSPRQIFKNIAKQIIGEKRADDIKPASILQNERRITDRLLKAVEAGNDEQALQLANQRLITHYMYMEARDARKRVDTIRKYMGGIARRKYNPKQVDPDYINQLKLLASMYDFRKGKDNDIRNAQQNIVRMVEWLKAQQESGTAVYTPELISPDLARVGAMIDNAKEEGLPVSTVIPQVPVKSFSDMTVGELEDVYNTARHLRFIGGKNSEQARAELNQAAQNLADSIREHGGDDVEVITDKNWLDKTKDISLRFSFDQVKLLSDIRLFDGFEDFGPMFNAIYQQVVDGTNKRIEIDLDAGRRIAEIWKPMEKQLRPKSDIQTFGKTEGLGSWSLSLRERIMLAVYWGSPESREAILEGHQVNEKDVQKMLNTLTDEQLDFVEKIWRFNESYWKELSRIEAAINGVPPVKVDHVPFEVNGRQLAGGYHRLYYEWSVKDKFKIDMHDEASKTMHSNRVSQSKTGATISRVGSGGRMVKLDPDNFFRAIEDNLQFIAFAEKSREVARLAQHPLVAQAIADKYGQDRYQSFIDSLDGVFAGDVANNNPVNKMLRGVRTNLTFGYLALSVRNFVQQPIALTNAMGKIGEGETLKAMMDVYMHPQQWWKFITKRSKFMEQRNKFVNREAAEQLAAMKSSSGLGWKPRWAFVVQTVGDAFATYPAWLAAYRQGYKKFNKPGTSEEALEKMAITYADEMVSSTVGSGLTKDLAPLFQGSGSVAREVGSETVKQLTFMGSFFNMTYNLYYDAWKRLDTGSAKSSLNFAREMAWYAVIPGILSAWAVGDGPDEDDDEGYWEWAIKATAEFGFSASMFWRNMVSTLKGFEPNIPAFQFFKGAGRISDTAVDVATGEAEFDGETAARLIRSFEPMVAMPGAGQAARTIEYLDSYQQGDEGEFSLHGMLIEGKER